MMLLRGAFVALAALSTGVTLWLGTTLYYHYYVQTCGPAMWTSKAAQGGTRAVVVSDVHLLGHRKRLNVERVWVDWQAWLSFSTIVSRNKPDLIIYLGDQFDEGTAATSDDVHQAYTTRFRQVFDSNTAQNLYLLGNHDAAFGHGLTKQLIGRHEATFGPSNRVVNVNNVLFLQLNTMAMESDVKDHNVYHDAMAFLNSVEEKRRATGYPPLVLLTHLPLYRPNDLECGAERAAEGGHVTYEAPSFKYAERHHVLSKALSERLLESIRPRLVLSGHSHAGCSYQHRVQFQPHPVHEVTVPTFSWGMRPDPSFAFLTLSDDIHSFNTNKDNPSKGIHVATCRLPRESHFIAVLVLTGAMHVTLAYGLFRHLWPAPAFDSHRKD